jgi:hypothetical protein
MKGRKVAGATACAIGITWTGFAGLPSPANFMQLPIRGSFSPRNQAASSMMHESVETIVASEQGCTMTSIISLMVGSYCAASAITARRRGAPLSAVACKALPTPSAAVEKTPAAPAADTLAVAAELPPQLYQTSLPPPPRRDFDPSYEMGVTEPLGYFDPLGFCKVGDYAGFHKLRCAEIKHGRVAMLAAVGTVFAHYVKFPGFEKTPAGLGALSQPAIVIGFFLLFPLAGFLEIIYWKDDINKEPGNFGDPANWASFLGDSIRDPRYGMRNKEINNGRMAMISMTGILLAELATGKDGIQQFGLP